VSNARCHGDFVSIDLAATIGEEEIDTAKGISYEIGTGNMIDGLDDALVGMAAEESKTFSAPLSGASTRAGRRDQCDRSVGQERVLPDLDDDFAQLASEFDTLMSSGPTSRVRLSAPRRWSRCPGSGQGSGAPAGHTRSRSRRARRG